MSHVASALCVCDELPSWAGDPAARCRVVRDCRAVARVAAGGRTPPDSHHSVTRHSTPHSSCLLACALWLSWGTCTRVTPGARDLSFATNEKRWGSIGICAWSRDPYPSISSIRNVTRIPGRSSFVRAFCSQTCTRARVGPGACARSRTRVTHRDALTGSRRSSQGARGEPVATHFSSPSSPLAAPRAAAMPPGPPTSEKAF